jgi:hypothetical protein
MIMFSLLGDQFTKKKEVKIAYPMVMLHAIVSDNFWLAAQYVMLYQPPSYILSNCVSAN